MSGNGQPASTWGIAIEGKPSAMLEVALRSVCRNGSAPQELPSCNGEACGWVRQVAECLKGGRCQAAVLFCRDAGLACCVANKVPGVRAAAVWTVPQAEQALNGLGANLLVVEQAGRTYFEFKQMLLLCVSRSDARCPEGVACVLKELDGHAHR